MKGRCGWPNLWEGETAVNRYVRDKNKKKNTSVRGGCCRRGDEKDNKEKEEVRKRRGTTRGNPHLETKMRFISRESRKNEGEVNNTDSESGDDEDAGGSDWEPAHL